MPRITHLKPEDARRLPWKNGRGETLEIAIWPERSSLAQMDFLWRISAATVQDPGPFSRFTGYDRHLVIIDEPGLSLSHGDEAPAHELAALSPYEFRGEWPTHAALRGAPVRDFNLICRRDEIRGSLIVLLDFQEDLDVEGEHALLHIVRGELHVVCDQDAGIRRLRAGDTLWMQDLPMPATLRIALAESAIGILATVRPLC